MLLPYVTATRFGNAIPTEGLAYPLFLIVIKYLLEGLLRKKTSALIKAFLLSALLILTRRQFLVFYPLFAMVVIYIYCLAPEIYRKHVLLLVLIATVAATHMMERTCQYLLDGHFRTIPFTGFHLVVAPLFVSRTGDGDFLGEEEQRIVFEKTHARMAERGLLKGTAGAGAEFGAILPIDHFYGSYNAICWSTLLPVLKEQGIDDWYRIDAITRGMAWTLARRNFRDCLKLYRLNAVRGAGGNGQAILLILFMLLAIGYHAVYRNGLSLMAAVVSMLSLGSLLLVALSEPARPRYIAYTTMLQVCICVIVVFDGFRRQLQERKQQASA